VAPDAAEKTTITKVLPVTNAPVSNVPDTTAGDPWAISFGHFVTRVGSRSAWWLLLLLLAALITIEVIRRRRARKNAEAK